MLHEVACNRPELKALADRNRVIVAFSGGADSVLAAHEVAATGKAMTFYYLHHYTTPVEPQRLEVFAETRRRYPAAHWVQQQADVRTIAKRMGYSWEHSASLLRRKRLLRLRAISAGSAVITGHNYSDYIETIALRRARKIPPLFWPVSAERDTVTGFLRPLFRLTRDEVRARTAALGLSWFEDTANTDLKFARNQIRASSSTLPMPDEPGQAFVTDFEKTAEGQIREISLSLEKWQALSQVEKSRTLFAAFRRLAIVRRFTRGHFAQAHRLPFRLPPFFAHAEGHTVIFRRGLGTHAILPTPGHAPVIRGDAVTRSHSLRRIYGRKSLAKIFSERKLSPRQRRQTLVYLQPETQHAVTEVVFPDGTRLRADIL